VLNVAGPEPWMSSLSRARRQHACPARREPERPSRRRENGKRTYQPIPSRRKGRRHPVSVLSTAELGEAGSVLGRQPERIGAGPRERGLPCSRPSPQETMPSARASSAASGRPQVRGDSPASSANVYCCRHAGLRGRRWLAGYLFYTFVLPALRPDDRPPPFAGKRTDIAYAVVCARAASSSGKFAGGAAGSSRSTGCRIGLNRT